MTIIKRSGKVEKLSKTKIFDSICKANDAITNVDCRLTQKQIKRISNSIFTQCENKEEPIDIDVLEDLIEEKIMENGAYEVAKRYITYRYEKERVRNNRYLTEKLTASNVQNQNANVDEYSFGGRVGEAASFIMKNYALNNLISKKSAHNHNNNEIYIHDLDSYSVGMHNCVEGNMWIKVRIADNTKTIKIKDLADIIGVKTNQLADTSNSDIYILSRDGWTKLNNIVKRNTKKDELLYTFKTRSGLPLKVTGNHRLPILRCGKEEVVSAKDIKLGDSLLDIAGVQLSSEELNDCFLDLTKIDDSDSDIRIVNISSIKHYLRYRYNVIFTEYAKEKGFSAYNNYRTNDNMTLRDFHTLCEEYPLSMEVLSTVRIKSNGSKHTYPLHIPFTSDLAKLYGYIYGDGGVYIRKDSSNYQLTFTNTNEELMKDFVKCYENVFGYKLRISYPRTNWNSPCIRVVDGSLIACKIFKNFAGAKKNGASDISLPDFILNGSNEIKYAFLSAAIDTDGCICDNAVTYTTCGDRYSDQIVLLLEGLGYHPTKVLAHSKGTKYRNGKISGIRNFDTYYVKMYRNDEISTLQEKMNSFKHSDKYAYRGLNNKFIENKIFSITTSDEEYEVYDVETGSHWFIVNNYVSHNCLSIPFDKLLKEGFNTRQTDIRPASSINTAFQLVAVIFQLQSLQQFGGVSATHLDWTMVPYVRKSFYKHYRDGQIFTKKLTLDETLGFIERLKDKYHTDTPSDVSIDDECYKSDKEIYDYALWHTIKELEQAVEGMYHNLNTLQSRSGNQLPFTSINYGTCTLPEGRLVIKALLDGCIKGVGKHHKTSIFPCGIFQCMNGINRKPEDPNYDLFKLALKSTSKRLYPNYANVDWSGNATGDIMDIKNNILSSLSNEQKRKLIDAIQRDQSIGDKLGIEISE